MYYWRQQQGPKKGLSQINQNKQNTNLPRLRMAISRETKWKVKLRN